MKQDYHAAVFALLILLSYNPSLASFGSQISKVTEKVFEEFLCSCLHICFFCRYGIKGAAYMKNKEGLVLSCQGERSCEWKPGSLQRFQNRITSTTTTGESVTLSLFDHITVST